MSSICSVRDGSEAGLALPGTRVIERNGVRIRIASGRVWLSRATGPVVVEVDPTRAVIEGPALALARRAAGDGGARGRPS